MAAPRWVGSCNRGLLGAGYRRPDSGDRPRQVLQNLLSRDRYTKDRKPAEGAWTVSSNMVIVGTGQMGASRIRNEIPDWILDDTASVASQVGLKRNEVEDFLGRRLLRRRWLLW